MQTRIYSADLLHSIIGLVEWHRFAAYVSVCRWAGFRGYHYHPDRLRVGESRERCRKRSE